MRIRAACCAAALAACAADAGASCGSAFCLVSTDWTAQGIGVEPGFLFDLHYESIDQDQPRSGTHNVSVGEIPRHHDEVETKNRNLVASVDWYMAPAWGMQVSIPYVDRDHLHIHNHQGEQIPETWHFRELGDMRVLLRHEMFATRDDPAGIRSAGVTFGIKLPTGKFDVANGEGEHAERTLQPGTGTTDLVLGGFWYSGNALADCSLFARAQVVLPLISRDDYKPGNQLSLDAGYRKNYGDVGLMLQVNYHVKGRDSGANAEPEDSGKRELYLSPGISWNAWKNGQVYAFAQLPLYQSVNGVQLVARWSALGGVSWRF